MLLVIDVGNTNIKYGVWKDDVMLASFRVSSRISRTADEYGSVLVNLLGDSGIKKTDVDGIIVSSVIPTLNYTICHMCEYFFGISPLMVGPGIKTGLNIKVENPKEVGADRIVNSVAAYKKYGGPVIVIDFGTATTFNVVD
ncbi:MAG: type III pantothenate kinase, partial [Clostridia bacterium]|nr:type III pantothenate kinase [Clostridia bacterium]